MGKEKIIFRPVTPTEIKKLIKCLVTIKAARIDTIPPKFIKVAADLLGPPLTAAITKSKEENISSESPKIASVVPRTTGKPNKNEFSNFRPVSVLNTFSKFYEKFIKKQF